MNGLNRFIEAQRTTYQTALQKIRNGKKINHWMWYIFPQIQGLGQSEISRYYAISDIEEARAYLKNEILGPRLKELSQALLELNNKTAEEIFGNIDSIKLGSSMTLFDYISKEDENIFKQVLDKYYHGKKDELTLVICNSQKKAIKHVL